MAGGRPTEYSAKIVERAIEYLDDCEDEREIVYKRGRGKNKFVVEGRLKVRLPTIEGLAFYLKVHKDTLYEWEKLHPEFSDVMADLRSKQADRLINNGISGEYNATIAKVLLTKHSYREGVEHTGDEGGPIKHDITGPLDKVYGPNAT